MLAQIIKISFLLILAALVVAFAHLNPTPATITVGAGNILSSSVGVIVLSAFALGIFCALLGASVYSIRGYFRERSMRQALSRTEALQLEMIDAQSLVRYGAAPAIEKKYRTLLKKNPDALLLRLDFIRALIAQRDFLPALSEIAAAKKIQDSEELYFLAAQCYEALGNKSAQLESLVGALTLAPTSIPALEQAATLSFQLNRFEDCLIYLDTWREIDELPPAAQRLVADAKASIIIRDATSDDDRSQKLLAFVVQYDNAALALQELARMKEAQGSFDEAAQCLVRLFRLSNDSDHMQHAVTLWLKHGKGEEALAALHTWQRMSNGDSKTTVSIALAKAYMLLGQDHEALDKLEALSGDGSLPDLQQKEVGILKALLALRRRDASGTALAINEIEKISLHAANS
jgi:tetratricopeptide (TPR) repeat protein